MAFLPAQKCAGNANEHGNMLTVRQQFGFSLSELMVVLMIITVLGVGVTPSLMQFYNKNKLNSEVNQLNAQLQLAKSTAATELVYVVFCPSIDKTQCNGSWSDGAISFIDNNHNNVLDETDKVLSVYQSASPIKLSVNRTLIVFSPINLSMTTAATFSLCLNNTLKKALVLSNVGRIRLKEEMDDIKCD